ncbi:MAG: L-2-amino-thiazoline-4-carboxylic acid hydrolase [Candidatus Thorarchaeota archaeon]
MGFERESTALASLIKRIARRGAWNAKKKTVFQVLTPRCRQDGKPEYGRFTSGEIKRVVSQAESNIKELMRYFIDFNKLGNYLNEYGGLIDLAIYRALREEDIESDYAMSLIGDMIWQARRNAKGLIPVYDPMRLRLARLRAKDPMDFLEKRLKDGIKFPYSEPGYRIKLYKDRDMHCMDIYSCPVYDFYKQFGEEEMTLFGRTWCTFDYAVAQILVEGGRYKREHTLSDGDDVCDMRWFIDAHATSGTTQED